MSAEITVRALSSNQAEMEVQTEFLKTYVRDLYNTHIVNWQYGKPNKNYGGLFFSKSADEVIASQGMIPIEISVKGKTIPSVKSESSFLKSEFRGKGVFETLYAHAVSHSEEMGSQLAWGFTALSKVWRKKLNFQVHDAVVHEAKLQLSLINALAHAIRKRGFKTQARAIGSALAQATKQLAKSTAKDSSLKVTQVNADQLKNSGVLEAFAQWEGQHKDEIFIPSSEEYLRWRVLENPVLDYALLKIYDEQGVSGVAILNTSEEEAYLVNLIVLDASRTEPVFNAMKSYIRRHFNFSYLLYWGNSRNKTNQESFACFDKSGAKRYPNTHMNLVLKRSDTSEHTEQYVYDPSNYYLNGLWTEGFKI